MSTISAGIIFNLESKYFSLTVNYLNCYGQNLKVTNYLYTGVAHTYVCVHRCCTYTGVAHIYVCVHRCCTYTGVAHMQNTYVSWSVVQSALNT